MSDSIIAIVPAAGVGARASRPGQDAVPKQYRPLGGQPMLRLAVSALLADARIAQVRVAVTPGDGWVDDALTAATHRVAPAAAPRVPIRWPARWPTAARPTMPGCWCMTRPGLVCRPRLARLIDACLKDPVGGLLALPVADTVKGGHERVERTLDRNGLWLAQTPQMFRAGAARRP